MGLHLVTGPASAGKSGILYNQLERAASVGLPVLALPAAPDMHRASREFAKKGVLGVRIVQLDRWIESLWHLHGDGRAPVTPAMRSVLLGEAIAQAQTVRSMGKVAETEGFKELLAQIVRVATDVPEARPAGTSSHIIDICQRYWNILDKKKCIEPAQIARVLGTDPPPGLGTIVANNFIDLSVSQEAFLAGVSSAAEVWVALTWAEGLASTEALDPLVERLLALGAHHERIEMRAGEGEYTEPALEVLANDLYCGRVVAKPLSEVELIEAGSVDAEVAAVANRVAELVSGGEEQGDIVIVARSMIGRAARMRAALQVRGVQAHVDVAVPFGATPFGKALFGLLAAVSGAGEREDLLAFVLSPYSGVGPAEAMSLDSQWRRSRATGEALLRASRRFEILEEYVNIAKRLVSPNETERAAWDWNELGVRMLERADTLRGLDCEQGREDTAAHRVMCETLDGLADAGTRLDIGSMVKALSATSVSAGAVEDGAVQITEVHRVRGRRFGTVIIMGLNADEFSSHKAPSLSDALLRELEQPVRSDERARERMLFYSIVTRARRRLVLSRQSVDEKGEEIRASVFWEETRFRAGKHAGDTADGAQPGGPPVDYETHHTIAAMAPAFTPGRIEERVRRACAQAGESAISKRGLVSAEEYVEWLSRREFSASEIERYLKCPYQWFVSAVLKPRELDRAVGARELGTLAHGLLKAFYDTWSAPRGAQRIKPDDIDEALEVFSATEKAYLEANRLQAVGLEEQIALGKARRWARAIIVDDADFLPGFEPHGHEVAFGEAAGRPFEFGGVLMVGRVDRVEMGPGGVLAIDYKSSSTVHGAGSFETYRLLQPTIYAAAAAQIFSAAPVGGVYRSLRSLQVRGFWREGCIDLGGRGSARDGLSPEAFTAELERAADEVASAVGRMRAAQIEPTPARKDSCDYCPVRDACEVKR